MIGRDHFCSPVIFERRGEKKKEKEKRKKKKEKKEKKKSF